LNPRPRKHLKKRLVRDILFKLMFAKKNKQTFCKQPIYLIFFANREFKKDFYLVGLSLFKLNQIKLKKG